MSLGDEHGHKANGVRRYDLSLQCSAVHCSGHFGEIIMFPPGTDPLYAGLFLPVNKAKDGMGYDGRSELMVAAVSFTANV